MFSFYFHTSTIYTYKKNCDFALVYSLSSNQWIHDFASKVKTQNKPDVVI